jgi:hypothetical protein
MPFAEDVRAELAAVAPARACDRRAELSALFHGAGNLHLRGRGEVSVHLDLSSSATARRAFRLLRAFDVETEIRTYTQRAFGRETRYQLHVAGNEPALKVLREIGVLGPRLGPLEAGPSADRARRSSRSGRPPGPPRRSSRPSRASQVRGSRFASAHATRRRTEAGSRPSPRCSRQPGPTARCWRSRSTR